VGILLIFSPAKEASGKPWMSSRLSVKIFYLQSFKILFMQNIQIGNTDLKVMPINLGGNVFGWTLNETESFKILDGFLDRGFNFIDTADVYSVWGGPENKGGESETIIGKWMKARGNRDKVVIATKVGWDFKDGRKGLKADYIQKASEDSLRRLQVDYIDLYYNHIDTGEVPLEETLGAFKSLIDAGKVRYIAASNVPADRLKASLELASTGSYPAYQALQPHYNLVDKAGYDAQLQQLASQYNLTVFPYWSLAGGFLTGKYHTKEDLGQSIRGLHVKKYLTSEGLAIIDLLKELSVKYSVTPAAIALAWLFFTPMVGAPLSSATKAAHLDILASVPELVGKIEKSDIDRLTELSDKMRYNQEG